MEVEVNLLAVLLAALSTLVVGSVWYAKPVFGKSWMKLVGKSEKEISKMGLAPVATALVVSVVTAYVLAHITYLTSSFYTDLSFFGAAVTTSVWLWLGFTAARLVTHDAFEGRPRQLTAINLLHELVTLFVMGAIIGLLGA